MEHSWTKTKTISIQTNVLSNRKHKNNTTTLPWGVTAQGINTLYKLHGRGMIVCKQKKTKTQTTGSYVTVGDRCVNMLCWISKGISFFFLFFIINSVFSLFFFPQKDISRSRYWDRWNVLGIHSTLQTSRLESRSDDYCLAHPWVFSTTLLRHWQERHTQQNRSTTTKHSENSTCPNIFMFLP